ncbi:hypothetical protein HPB51_028974 [Rhipicephalus microplus]|uniref:Uncharacterized protein n=1 Tax=Rhipicephalus microplus TaxID=6941 RepID=A0A9J6CW82_RHIMP|nr:hypothetical protein HPB51_028974 [Rhipicephalus microplus]
MQEVDFGAKQRPSGFPKSRMIPQISQRWTSVRSKDPAAFPNRGCDSTDFSLLSYAGGGLRCEAKTQQLSQIEGCDSTDFSLLSYAGGGLRCEAKTQRLSQIEAVIPQISQRWTLVRSKDPATFLNRSCDSTDFSLLSYAGGGLRCEAKTQRLSQIEAVIPQISQRWTSVRSKDQAAFRNRGCDSTDFSLLSYAGGGLRCEAKTQRLSQIEAVIPQILRGGLRCEAKTKRLSEIEAVIPQISQRWTSVRSKDPATFPNRGCDSTDFSLLSYAGGGLQCEPKTQWLSQIEAVIPQISQRWTSVRSKDPAASSNRGCDSTDFPADIKAVIIRVAHKKAIGVEGMQVSEKAERFIKTWLFKFVGFNEGCLIYLNAKHDVERTSVGIRRDMTLASRLKTPVNALKGVSPPVELTHFDLVWGYTVKYMPNVLLGLTRHFAHYWFDSSNSNEPSYMVDYTIHLMVK